MSASKPTISKAVDQLSSPPIPAVQEWAAGYDGKYGPLIDLSQAVPGYAPPQLLLDFLSSASANAALLGYGRIEGEALLRDSYAQEVSRFYGASINSTQTHITSGCNQAFIASVMALAQAGDTIMMTNPCYFNHETTLDMLGIHTAFLDCEAGKGFLPDTENLRELLKGVKALALVSPNNPTGNVYPADLLADVLNICRETGTWLILDETYRDFMPAELRHKLLDDDRWSDNLVLLYSFSKSFCIPGHRLGAVIAGEHVVEAVAKVMDNMQICAPRAAQTAVAQSIAPLREWRLQNQQEIQRRAETMRRAIETVPDWNIEAMGAYFAYVRHPFTRVGSMDVAQKLANEIGVSSLPGAFFGSDQELYLRFAFANVDSATIETLPERLIKLEFPD